MKKLLLFVIACTLGLFGTVRAQETSFNYDFNDGSLAGWRLIDHNGDGYNWGASNSTLFGGVDGTYGLYSSCYEGSSLLPKNYIMTENKYLITESSVFSFVHIQSDALYYSENICVVVSDDINDTPADFDQIWCEEYSSPYTEWQEVSVSLAAYAGQEVYIGLYHYGSGSNATGIRVDNVKLEGAAGEGGGEEPTPEPEPTPTIPAAPASLVATANGQNSITLTWEAVEGATSYNIYSTAAGNVLAVTATEYTYEGLTAGTYYCFDVTAENTAGESYDSAYACATTEEATEEPETQDPNVVTIGDASANNTTANANYPFANVSTYSHSQQIYTPATISAFCEQIPEGDITKIKYYIAETSQSYFSGVKVYMRNSLTSSFSSKTAWDKDFTAADLVFEGEVDVVDNAIEFVLQKSFTYDPTMNLIIYVDVDTKNGTSQTKFKTYSAAAKCALYYKNQNNNGGLDTDYLWGPSSSSAANTINVVSLTFAGEGGEEPTPEPEPTPVAPAAPEDYAANAISSSEIVLTWAAVEGATGYKIYYSIGTEEFVVDVTETTYTFENLEAYTAYCFEIAAVNEAGESARTSAFCTTTFEEPTPVAPAAPQNVVATANGQNSIIVTWNAVDGAAYYIVYKDGQMWDQVNGTTYTSTGLTAGTEYCYAVQAVANDLESELSEEVCETTDPAFDIPEGVIWNCSVEFVLSDSYGDGWNNNNLYVSYGDVTEKLTLTGGQSTTYVLEIPKGTHVTVTYKPEGSYQSENRFGVRYYGNTEYICTQYTIDNNKTYTHEFDVNCEPSMPSVPALTATATGGSTIVLTIEGAGAESYNIYEGGELFAESVTGNTYTVEGLEPETEYCFTATAVNFLGETEPSEAACATTLKAGTAIVQVGTGTTNTYQAPICDYYSSYSVSQMIYTEEEIGYGSGKVTSISFYQNEGTGPTRSLSVYMKNVSKDIFGNGTAEWEALEADLCVYQGSFTFGTSGWVEIALQDEFVYEAGNNLLVCVIDNTGSFPAGNIFEGFAADVVTDIKTIFGTGNATDPLNITTNSYPLMVGPDNLRPIAKFVLEPAPADVKVKPETIAFGEVQLGEYWSENGAATIAVTVKPIITTITSITCDNEFFVLPAEIDYTANPIEFAVAYDSNAAAGEYTGNLTITYGDGATKVVPMTATAYAPATADVFELAQEITFTENAYTDTPVFANLHDDYNLPKEANNGNTPDAVYSFELAKESYVAVEVAGTNAVYALYQEDFSGEEGPKADNKVKGNGALSSFAYDFNDGNLDEFYMIEKDAVTENYKNHEQNWKVVKDGPDASNCLISFSYSSNPSIHDANNYIVTKDKYVISADSKLTFDARNYGAGDPDYLKIEVSEDGENFTYLVTATPGMGAWEPVEVELGTLLASAGLEYGEYHIALHHEEVYHMYIMVDNLALTSSNVSKISYPAGNYYLVAAAEDEFTVNVAIEALEGEEPTPTAKAYRLESVGTAWGATEYIYDEENTNTVVAIDEDGIVSEVTYNEAGQIASAIASYEDVDEEGNPIEVIVSGVEYEYDENGVWTSYTETSQSWFGGTVTSETVLNYDAEGRLVSLTSEEYVRTIAYNEAGLISEVVEGYIVVEEEGEEGDEEGEEGDDNGIAPLSETEIEYSSKITFEYDAEGRLVEKNYYSYDAYETMEFYWGESEVYTYDENGNCVKKEAYEVTEENELKSFPYSVTEYIYDLTINNENVYKFEYPHFAFINYVEPSYANILVKEMSYYSYYDEDVEDVVSHSYEVTAYNYNPAVVLLPLTPMNLTAEVLSATEVELAWAGFPDAETFTLYQVVTEGLDPCFIVETVIAEGLVDPYYTVENLEMGVEYCFAVMATNSVGNSEVSETVCVTIELPAAPANLVAKATSDTEIALTWDEVPGVWTYNVYQVVETAEETTYELLGEAWWTEYTVTELTAETEYSFVVKAVSNVGESAASNVATAKTLAPPVPAAPVVTGSFEGDKVILEWEAVEGALAYNLYNAGKLLAGPFEDLIVEIQVPAPDTYCFTVTAVNEVGESEHSEEVCVTVTVPEDMEAPAAPVLEVTLDGNKAILSWEEVEGATYYDVYIQADPESQYLGTATMQSLPISLELPEHGIYCFYVIAYNLAGASEPSNVACVNYGNVGVEENEASFNIYPNPVSDRLVIETEANIEAVTIYTVTGVVVYSEVDFNNNTIDVSDFANGVYIMKVRTDNGEAVQRFIKK